uniref:Uncharacterized protein n=1 Tax=Arundo donax TaxID=35708 RepID=A0A0A9BES7_ARUDO
MSKSEQLDKFMYWRHVSPAKEYGSMASILQPDRSSCFKDSSSPKDSGNILRREQPDKFRFSRFLSLARSSGNEHSCMQFFRINILRHSRSQNDLGNVCKSMQSDRSRCISWPSLAADFGNVEMLLPCRFRYCSFDRLPMAFGSSLLRKPEALRYLSCTNFSTEEVSFSTQHPLISNIRRCLTNEELYHSNFSLGQSLICRALSPAGRFLSKFPFSQATTMA